MPVHSSLYLQLWGESSQKLPILPQRQMFEQFPPAQYQLFSRACLVNKAPVTSNSGCLFSNDTGNFLITKLPSLFWGLTRKPLANTDSAHRQLISRTCLGFLLLNFTYRPTSIIFMKPWWGIITLSPPWILHLSFSGMIDSFICWIKAEARLGHLRKNVGSLMAWSAGGAEWGSESDGLFKDKQSWRSSWRCSSSLKRTGLANL